jgi:hypothetical protein
VTVPTPLVVRGPDGRFLPGTARPPKRRKGGQPGNLNQTRHAWAVYWRKRALRPEDRWIASLLGDYAAGLVSDRGGPEGVTATEARMVELAALARGCTMLVLAEAAKRGGLIPAGKGPDLPAALARFATVEARCLLGLGLERRAKPVPALQEYLAERYGPKTTAAEPLLDRCVASPSPFTSEHAVPAAPEGVERSTAPPAGEEGPSVASDPTNDDASTPET